MLHLANTISGVAQGITMLAVPWYFVKIIGHPDWFGWLFFVVTFISMFWGVYAGTLIDAYNRRRIFLWTNVFGFTSLLAVALCAQQQVGAEFVWPALAFAATSFIYNIHFTNLYAFAQEITEPHYYSRVISQLEIQSQLTFTLSGGIAAAMLNGVQNSINLLGVDISVPFSIPAFHISDILFINAATYLITFFVVLLIRSMSLAKRERENESLLQRLRIGFSFLRHHGLIFLFGNVTLLLFLCVIVCGLYVLPVYVDKFMHRSGDVYAQGDMVFSLGALLAGLFTNKVFGEKNPVLGILVLMSIAGLLYLSLGFTNQVVWLYVAFFFIGTCNAAVRIQRVTYVFHHVPNQLIGRSNSVWFVVNVFFRLLLVAFASVPFFTRSDNIRWMMVCFALICFTGVLLLAKNYKRLMQEPEVQS